MEKNSNKNAQKDTQKNMNRTEFAQEYSIDTSKKTNKTNKTEKNCNKNSNYRFGKGWYGSGSGECLSLWQADSGVAYLWCWNYDIYGEFFIQSEA